MSQPKPDAIASSLRRVNVFALVITLAISLMGLWAVWVQAIDANGSAKAALNNLLQKPQTIPALRGTITDRSGVVLAQTLPYVLIKADPYGIARNGVDRGVDMSPAQIDKAAQAPAAIAGILMTYLGGSADDYLGHLTRAVRSDGTPNRYEPIAANVPTYTWTQIKSAMNDGGWYGLASDATPIRVYPDGRLISNVLGFTGSAGQALAGFELGQDAGLRGTNGVSSYETSAYGQIPLGDNTLVPAVNGDSYQLTIDAVIQQAAEQELLKKVSATRSDFGIAIVMDIKTGEVLAMANAPTFDGNAFGKANQADTGNRAVQSQYEPGSVQKVLTMAALLDQGLITPDTRLVVPNGIQSGGHVLHDAESHPTWYLTARGVVAHSSNIGAVMLARQSDKQTLMNYLSSFGLGRATGIQLPGESSGTLNMSPSNAQRDSMAFGQSLSVTAIQEAAAVAAVTNGGVYHQPTIIKSVTDASGHLVPQPDLVTRRVISAEASSQVVNMMESVTESALYSGRSLDDYSWAGKTGTANRYDETAKRYRGITASFMAVAPANDPQFLVYVVLDNPAGGGSGGTLALPVARDLMMVALSHYGVPPSPPAPYTDPIAYKP